MDAGAAPFVLAVTMHLTARYRLATNLEAGVYNEQVYFTPSRTFHFRSGKPGVVQIYLSDGRAVDIGVRRIQMSPTGLTWDCLMHEGWTFDDAQSAGSCGGSLDALPLSSTLRESDEQITLVVESVGVLQAQAPEVAGPEAVRAVSDDAFDKHTWFTQQGPYVMTVSPGVASPVLSPRDR